VVDVPAVQLFTGSGAGAATLSTQMQQAWLAFARSGDPAHAALEGGWPTWGPRKRSTMVFGPRTGAVDAPRNAELAIWERYRPLFSPEGP
jgi:para-nitrobenzyl esterase